MINGSIIGTRRNADKWVRPADWWNPDEVYAAYVPPVGYRKQAVIYVYDMYSQQNFSSALPLSTLFKYSDGIEAGRVNHVWDKAFDAPTNEGYYMRYIIVCGPDNTRDLSINFGSGDAALLYIKVYDSDLTVVSAWGQTRLQAFEMDDLTTAKTTGINIQLGGNVEMGKAMLPLNMDYLTTSLFEGSSYTPEVRWPTLVKGMGNRVFYNCFSMLFDGLIVDDNFAVGSQAFFNCFQFNNNEICKKIVSLGSQSMTAVGQQDYDFSSLGDAVIENNITIGTSVRRMKFGINYKMPAVGLPFGNNQGLTEIELAPEWVPTRDIDFRTYYTKLSYSSIKSGIFDMVGTTNIPITWYFNATQRNQFTEADIQIMTDKGYIIA